LEKIGELWDICFSKTRRKPEKYIFLKFDISFKFVFLNSLNLNKYEKWRKNSTHVYDVPDVLRMGCLVWTDEQILT
jgi:hypothetical protein